MKSAVVRVYEVLIDSNALGPACDGTVVRRFRSEREALQCAAQSTCYGSPARANPVDVPKHVARRWGLA